MGFELSAGTGVDLWEEMCELLDRVEGNFPLRWTDVELVQLGFDGSGLLGHSQAGEQSLGNGIDDAQLVGAEGGGESGGIELSGLPVGLIVDIFAITTKGRRLHVLDELIEILGDGGLQGKCDLGLLSRGASVPRVPAKVDRER